MSDNPRQTVWVCKVDAEHTIRLEDIPAKDLGDLEKRLETSWLTLVGAPLGLTSHALAMYEKACQVAGVPPRDLTAGELLAAFELVDDDRPDYYRGTTPDPKAEDRQTV